MRTLFLHPETWDLTLDSDGNIATATGTYQQAQDIATACRVFVGDLYYNKNAGIPYREEILGKSGYPLALYKMNLEQAALSVEGVVSAQAMLTSRDNRVVTGSIIFTNSENKSGAINL